MNNLIFWIIVCSWLIPMGIRMYNRSRRRRIQDGDYGRNVPGNPPGPYIPGQYEQGPYTPGRYDPRPYDPSRYPPGGYFPDPSNPAQPPVVIPSEPRPPVATHAPQAAPPSSATPAPNPAPNARPNNGPQGYRARKLAELDQDYSDGKIAMEDYMKLRQEIMNG
ncbi:hypothetical protein [Arthrobacter bambusae]|uniref:hypothetical protein n=1 Tax=Arthrobacter bambusae TaxID=1338426 RepID=UPI00277FBAC6|nr:hypothetical protein [Arthrobacter bambusae]MDQ0029134.1 hypothetical protein [Arthrobacter bambusae]MDQ0098043.1 hypothetical protein [Arthrobacter bambusae]